jgi:hypothetical protein
MDGHRAADWENGKSTSNADWTDNNGYYGGHWGGYGNHGYGSGKEKNEEENNWDDGSNDKEKEGYYPTRDEIKEDTKMLSKLKPDWIRNPWHYYGGYGYGHGYGYGGKDGKGGKGGKDGEKGKEGEEGKGGDDKAEDKAELQAAADDFVTPDSAEDPNDDAGAEDPDALNVQTKTSKTSKKKKKSPKHKKVHLSQK